MELNDIRNYLQAYNGEGITIMEVCGSHTAAIAKYGIRGMLSDKIRLVSGPGCPVCVTPTAYIDRLIELSEQEHTCVVTFGDLLRVPGSSRNLNQARAAGGNVQMVYAPHDMLKPAKENPDVTYVFAAVGFETTAPVYTLLIEEAQKHQLTNIRLLTALKTMPEALAWLCENGANVDGFIAPGHVSAITGSDVFLPLAKKYEIPFGVAGFGAEELLIAIYGIIRQIERREYLVKNYYPAVVTAKGNTLAQEKLDTYFEGCDAIWRGMGNIPLSGLALKENYRDYDAGSRFLIEDKKINQGCRCDQILMGKLDAGQCPLFKTVCHPANPQGACMVSQEGSCYQRFMYDKE